MQGEEELHGEKRTTQDESVEEFLLCRNWYWMMRDVGHYANDVGKWIDGFLNQYYPHRSFSVLDAVMEMVFQRHVDNCRFVISLDDFD